MAYSYSLSTQETRVRGSRVPGQPGLPAKSLTEGNKGKQAELGVRGIGKGSFIMPRA